MSISYRWWNFHWCAVVEIPITKSIGQFIESLCVDLLVCIKQMESCWALNSLSWAMRNEVEIIQIFFDNSSINDHSSVWIDCFSTLRSIESCITLVVASQEYNFHCWVFLMNSLFHQLNFSWKHQIKLAFRDSLSINDHSLRHCFVDLIKLFDWL